MQGLFDSGIDSVLTWFYKNGHTTEHLRIRQFKEEQRVIPDVQG